MSKERLSRITLVIDGVIFQLQKGRSLGISNVWRMLLHGIAQEGWFKRVYLLDRGNAPKISGIESIPFVEFESANFSKDCVDLNAKCEELGCDFFMSTQYTQVRDFPNLMLVHDFIPEKLGFDLNMTDWLNKSIALSKSRLFFCVSKSTLDDLTELYPQYKQIPRCILYNCVGKEFYPRETQEVDAVLKKYQIERKFFVILGRRMTYKNVVVFFKAFSILSPRERAEYQVVCVGGHKTLEYILRFYIGDSSDVLNLPDVDDGDLAALLSGAQALMYPSLYEGFGLPVLEAMSCGCPVVVSSQAKSCVEVGADAIIECDAYNPLDWREAIRKLADRSLKAEMSERGLERAKKFSAESTINQFHEAVGSYKILRSGRLRFHC